MYRSGLLRTDKGEHLMLKTQLLLWSSTFYFEDQNHVDKIAPLNSDLTLQCDLTKFSDSCRVVQLCGERWGCGIETSDLRSDSSCASWALKQPKETKRNNHTASWLTVWAPERSRSLKSAHGSLSSPSLSLYQSSHLSALCSAFWAEFKHQGPV